MTISAFGIDHGVVNKGLRSYVQDKVVEHHQKQFNAKYPVGDNQQVRTKDAHRIRWRHNIMDQQKVNRLAPDLKTNGQKKPVGIGRHDVHRESVVWDGHHRIAAAKKAKLKYVNADVHEVTWPPPKGRPAPYRQEMKRN